MNATCSDTLARQHICFLIIFNQQRLLLEWVYNTSQISDCLLLCLASQSVCRFQTFMPLKADVCNSYCRPLRKCSWTVFSIDRQSFDRDKAAAVAQQCHSVVKSIERTVLTRQSFVSLLQSPDLSRVYKEVWESPASGLV